MAHISNGGRRVYDSDIQIPKAKQDFIGKQHRLSESLVVEQPKIDKINLKNKTFRIKSLYKEYCLDVKNNVVYISKIDAKKSSQLWKYENNYLIHIDTSKKISKDGERDVVLTNSERPYSWDIKEGGFIINERNNVAIDIKGGINDRRNEVWLFTLNYSRAQQWQFIDCEEIVKEQPPSQKKNTTNYVSLFKITSKNTQKSIDVVDDKIVVRPTSDSDSQLWRYSENNKLIHHESNLPLSYDEENNLVLDSENYRTHEWIVNAGTYIISKKSKMAIDNKGGVNDSRNEVWLFRHNNSPAQQWVLNIKKQMIM